MSEASPPWLPGLPEPFKSSLPARVSIEPGPRKDSGLDGCGGLRLRKPDFGLLFRLAYPRII